LNNFQDKANFVWQVADDILRSTFKQHEYGDVILPFVVLRRLDCVLNGIKEEVIKTYEQSPLAQSLWPWVSVQCDCLAGHAPGAEKSIFDCDGFSSIV
jgi:type I restriction-modification system DNA methylase subunit